MARKSLGDNRRNGGARELKIRVRTARGRKLSSTRWLQRQLNDPYVRRAKAEGYRGRAAYKIMELDDRFGFLLPGKTVVDLGCAPGGWLQVAVERVNARGDRPGRNKGTVLGIDIHEVEPLAGATIQQLDFMAEHAEQTIQDRIGGQIDVLMSDMAVPSTGHQPTDHLRIVALCEAAAHFSFATLVPGGVFVSKVLAGGAERELQTTLKKRFTKVANVKPPSSRPDSSEKYVLAIGFRG